MQHTQRIKSGGGVLSHMTYLFAPRSIAVGAAHFAPGVTGRNEWRGDNGCSRRRAAPGLIIARSMHVLCLRFSHPAAAGAFSFNIHLHAFI
jgi:hypothetical protein